jgi:hypothetical protein
MKLQGFVGKGSGKLGASVWTVRKGVQVVREYTNKVTNPNTKAQVGQRAKFKLLTQLGAVVAGDGMFFRNLNPGESMRNAFMRANMSAVTLSPTGDVALLNVSAVMLTDGHTTAPNATFNRSTGALSVDVSSDAMSDIMGIGYAVITLPDVGRVIGYSARAEKAEGETTITATIITGPTMMNKTNVLVWGYRFADAAARAKYEAIAASETADVVALEFDRMLREGLIEPTQTIIANPTQA